MVVNAINIMAATEDSINQPYHSIIICPGSSLRKAAVQPEAIRVINIRIIFKSFLLIICISVLNLSTNVNFFLLFYLVLFLIIFIFYSFFSKKIKSYGEKTITADREITKVIQESFDGFKNVIIYNQFDFIKRKFIYFYLFPPCHPFFGTIITIISKMISFIFFIILLKHFC